MTITSFNLDKICLKFISLDNLLIFMSFIILPIFVYIYYKTLSMLQNEVLIENKIMTFWNKYFN